MRLALIIDASARCHRHTLTHTVLPTHPLTHTHTNYDTQTVLNTCVCTFFAFQFTALLPDLFLDKCIHWFCFTVFFGGVSLQEGDWAGGAVAVVWLGMRKGDGVWEDGIVCFSRKLLQFWSAHSAHPFHRVHLNTQHVFIATCHCICSTRFPYHPKAKVLFSVCVWCAKG